MKRLSITRYCKSWSGMNVLEHHQSLWHRRRYQDASRWECPAFPTSLWTVAYSWLFQAFPESNQKMLREMKWTERLPVAQCSQAKLCSSFDWNCGFSLHYFHSWLWRCSKGGSPTEKICDFASLDGQQFQIWEIFLIYFILNHDRYYRKVCTIAWACES